MRRALDVLGQRVLLGKSFRTDDAGDRRGAAEPLLLDQELKRTITPPAGRNFKYAGLGAGLIEHRPNGQALKQRAACDVLRKLFDRHAGLDAAHIRLAQYQLIEGNVP